MLFPGLPGGAGDAESSFEEIFADLFGMRPVRKMLGGFGMMFPTFVIPTMGLVMPGTAPETNAGPGTGGDAVVPERAGFRAKIDEEMKKRREINVLREQLKQAVKSEEFEKAAILRDKIRELEGGEGV
jgi:protein arginine kinase activator